MIRMRRSCDRRRYAAGAAGTWPGAGDGAAPSPGDRHRARRRRRWSPSTWRRQECAGLRDGHRRGAARARAGAGQLRAGDLRAGREPGRGHHIPVHRATLLLCQLAGIAVSTGWMAGIRGRAAALVEASGFMDRVRELLKTAPAVHADETPARAAGGTRYVHLACTRYLTCMHTGDRSAEAIDAGGVLPGYEGVIVRDGYAGYGHLTSALHAWCAVHLLRDLKGLYDFEPAQQEWASQMAALLIEARDAAAAARQAGQSVLDAAVLDDLVTRYRALAAAGLAANLYRRTATAKDARRLARRFLGFEDLILRFATRPDLDIFSNNEAERTIRPAKVQQRSSGGCWRTLARTRRVRARPVLPVHRRQMGHQQTRRPPRPVQRPRLAPARPRTRRISQHHRTSRHAADAC